MRTRTTCLALSLVAFLPSLRALGADGFITTTFGAAA